MSPISPNERRFEEHIERELNSLKFFSRNYKDYDRELCLIHDEVIDFIKNTQQEKWNKLIEINGVQTEKKLLKRISSEISKRGIIDVIRNKVVDLGIEFDLCYYQPKSDLNPDLKKLYDFNKFTLVRQLHYSTKNENSIDIVLFLNGLPLITIELKNEYTGQNFKNAEHQYKNDRDPIEPLLRFKRCMVHFCVDKHNISMTTRLSGRKTFFLPYNRDIENPPVDKGYRTKYLWEEILTPDSILDILQNFVHLANEEEYFFNEKTQKIDIRESEKLIFPRYHQLNLIKNFRNQIKKDGVGNNYLVQHTTGSGKSYSIGWLSHTLTSLYQKDGDTKRIFDSIIVVTDRKVLDNQLQKTINDLKKNKGVVYPVEKGSSDLKKFLESGKDIIISTIQKFPQISDTISSLGDKRFAVIIDEVHSSQSGQLSKELKKSLSKDEDEDEFDFEDLIREEIKNRGRQKHISFFGFTGTPKEKTLELFGTKQSNGKYKPFHEYSMYQSIHEGFTLDVLQNYTTYKRFFKLKQTRDGDIEIPTSKGKRELIKYVDSNEMTIRTKVQIILDHWINKGSKEIQGKSRGMIVVASRKHCVWYSEEINKQLSERGMEFKSLVGFSGEVSINGEKYTESGCNLKVGHEGDVPLGLKNPKYRLLVVANKFQTGFDEPLLQSMYIDKKLGGVQCIQTLSRLNRTTRGKNRTFVLDFKNEPQDINDSFQRFYKSLVLEGETDPNILYDYLREIKEFNLYTSEDINQFCKSFLNPYREGDEELTQITDPVVDDFKNLETEEEKSIFKSKIQSYMHVYGYLSQIIKFSDIELEKHLIFLKFLNKDLPKRSTTPFYIDNSVDIESLRIQKIYEKVESPVPETQYVSPPRFGTGGDQEPEYDLLSELIDQVNRTYGGNLNDEDKVQLNRLNEKLELDEEVKKYMQGDNSEDNKKNFFSQRCENMIIDDIDNSKELYKKISGDEPVKNFIFKLLYENYQKSMSKL
tara:strand:+ start:3221 stop:6163 length:2943 start_codon:yes stop_codon:yes gene_type:complete